MNPKPKRLPITKKIGLEQLLLEYDRFSRLKTSMTSLAINFDTQDFFVAGMTLEIKNKSNFKFPNVILKIDFKDLKILGMFFSIFFGLLFVLSFCKNLFMNKLRNITINSLQVWSK
jgi:hypothetical protein